MGRRSKPRSKEKAAAQKVRSANNKRKKAAALIAKRPNDPHRAKWEKNL